MPDLTAQPAADANGNQRWHVLVLCVGNSARSIMAEALFNSVGSAHFCARSAGSNPTGRVHPLALAQIGTLGVDTGTFYSKSWDVMLEPGTHPIDFVITVCDHENTCPEFPGSCTTVHWGLADPAAVTTSEQAQVLAFKHCFEQLQQRLHALLAMPIDWQDREQVAAGLKQLEAP